MQAHSHLQFDAKFAGEREEQLVVATPAALRVNFGAPGSNRSFPGSLMGVVAYLRQVFSDASHYRESWTAYEREPRGKRRPGYDRALAPLAEAQVDGWPVLMPGHWKHEIERAVRLGAVTQGLTKPAEPTV